MTLREQITKGLGDKWTQELEDSLFLSVSDFLDRIRVNIRKQAFHSVEESLENLLREIKIQTSGDE